MVDFSSVNLRILSPDGKSVLAELQTIDRAGQRTARSVAGAGKAAVEDFGHHAAMTSRRVAGELSMIAHEGAISARSLKSVAIEASNAAFAFGSTGIIAGAVALTGIAIFNLFSRTRDEIRETNRVAMEEIERLAKAGSIGGVASRAQELFSGQRFAVQGKDESDVAFQARQIGIQGIRAKISDITARFSASSQLAGALGESARTLAKNEIQPWSDELDKLAKQHERLIGLLGELNVKESDLAGRRVADLRAHGAEERKQALDELLRSNRSGAVPGIVGKPMSFFNAAEFGPAMLKGIVEALKKIPTIPSGEITPEIARIAGLKKLADDFGDMFGKAIADGIGAGITTAFEKGANIGNVFASFAGAVLGGLGSMFERIGLEALKGLILMKAIRDAIFTWALEGGIVAAFSLIAFGAILKGVGGRITANSPVQSSGQFGAGAGSGSGYGGSNGPANDFNRLYLSGKAPAQVSARTPMQFVMIGANDPRVQRDVAEIVKKASARGLI